MQYALVIRKDHSVELYQSTGTGLYHRLGEITYTHILVPETIEELINDMNAPAAVTWMNAMALINSGDIDAQFGADNLPVMGVTNDVGEFIQIDIATLVLAVKPVLEQHFAILIEAHALAA